MHYHRVLVASVEPVDMEVLGAACDAVERYFQAVCYIEDPLAVPESAYDPHRGQYRSDVILGYLRLLIPKNVEKLIAITELDLFVPGLNFVFGQAALNGQEAVVSVARLRPEFYGQTPNTPLFLTRVRKEVIHEMGHLYGLDHCPDRSCVMTFSNSIVDVDAKGEDFCPRCRALLEERLKIPPASGAP